jgi:hypothetical protein
MIATKHTRIVSHGGLVPDGVNGKCLEWNRYSREVLRTSSKVPFIIDRSQACLQIYSRMAECHIWSSRKIPFMQTPSYFYLSSKVPLIIDACDQTYRGCGRMLDNEFQENRLIVSMGYCRIDCCYKITTTINT